MRLAKVKGHDDPFAIGRFVAEAERCLAMLDAQLGESGGPFVLGSRCTVVDVACFPCFPCFPCCASAYWANTDTSELTHLRAWLEMLHERPAFKTGLSIPFRRPAFFGPPHATQAQIDTEIARNAAQFAIVTKPVE